MLTQVHAKYPFMLTVLPSKKELKLKDLEGEAWLRHKQNRIEPHRQDQEPAVVLSAVVM